ncbi:MAG: replicative DNA helicase, partial [Oscillospiraceae bacterium]|nr:replicative DNA helicase [Oscillospiraceae bacterium]
MDELMIRQIPHSAEAEQSVLGAMLIDARCVADVTAVLKSSDFYSDTNRDVFDAVFSMFSYSMTIDPVTVLDHMKTTGVWNENSTAYVLELM